MFRDQHYLCFLYFQVSLFYLQYVALWKKRTQNHWTEKTVSLRGKQKQKAFKLAFSELVKLQILSIRITKQNNPPKNQESQNNLILGSYWRKCTWGPQFRIGIYFILKHPGIWSVSEINISSRLLPVTSPPLWTKMVFNHSAKSLPSDL